MVSILSPGVYLVEKDLSNYPVSIGTTTVGVVGFATKGPINKPTLITSQENLEKIFGLPDSTLEGQGLQGALEILEATNTLYYIRAAKADAQPASVSIPLVSCPAIGLKAGEGYGVTANLYLTVQGKDHKGNPLFPGDYKVFAIPSGTVPATSNQQTALAKVLGTDLDTLKVTAQYETTTNEFGEKVPVSSEGVEGFIVNSFGGPLTELSVSAFKDAGLVSGYAGVLYPLSGVAGISGTPTAVAANVSAATAYSVITDAKYYVETLYPGTGYNLTSMPDNTIRGNSIEIISNGGAKSTLVVNDAGASYETFKVSFVNDSTFVENVINTGMDNLKSEVIKAQLESVSDDVDPTPLTSFVAKAKSLLGVSVSGYYGTTATALASSDGPRFLKMRPGTYDLDGGTNGMAAGEAWKTDVINAIPSLDNDLLNLTVAVVPGITDVAVQNSLITLAETTQNFIAMVSPPVSYDSVQEVIDWSNGLTDERSAAINSSYAAIYWPWVTTYIPSLSKDEVLDPAIYGARQLVYTASVGEIWFAPAGFIRGRLTKPSDVEVDLRQGDRDSLYSGGNAINPIVNFPQQGITIFGQRTAQRNPTALDRINVRMLSIYLKKTLLASVRTFLFEPNDPILWKEIENVANTILADVQSRRGITEYKVTCDSTTNTPVRVDRNELWCKVVVKPTKTAEAIVFELNLTSQSGTVS